MPSDIKNLALAGWGVSRNMGRSYSRGWGPRSHDYGQLSRPKRDYQNQWFRCLNTFGRIRHQGRHSRIPCEFRHPLPHFQTILHTAQPPVPQPHVTHAVATSYATAVAPPVHVSRPAAPAMDLDVMRQASSHLSNFSFGAPYQGFGSFGVAHPHYNAFSGRPMTQTFGGQSSSREFAQINTVQQERLHGRFNGQRRDLEDDR